MNKTFGENLTPGDGLFGIVYDRAYAEIRHHTGETDNRTLNGAARNIAEYVVRLAQDEKLNEGDYDGKDNDKN